MTTIHEILDGLRASALDERDKGGLFETLTKSWLEISPEYSDLFDKIWTYADWAQENDIPKNDIGIDLVARDAETQEFCGIQCKFYAADHTVQKKDIDSFFTALSRKHFTSGLIFSTSEKWSSNAEGALVELTKPIVRIGLHDLANSGVDWSKFSFKKADQLVIAAKKQPFQHQQEAISDALGHFKEHNRGKLIMACGTGKTFTSLRLAEQMVPDGGTMLFLVPSIALLSQSLKEWKQEAERPITAYAVCSDVKVGKTKSDEDIQVTDLAYPATTNAKKLVNHFESREVKAEGFTVIFSTYQSIDVISKAQKMGLVEFDLVICDEAHRTTGVTLAGSDESAFVRVHDDAFLRAKKRLYMTATPRIYAEQSKQKAADADATLASMDNEELYGAEFHRLNFGKAVSAGLLSDYKVLVLAVSEEHVSRQLQKLLTRDGELDLDDATKIVGCYNGLRKRSNNPEDFIVDSEPMKSAVAFSRSIKDSQRLANLFQIVTEELNKEAKEKDAIKAEADHVDGTFNMESRLTKLDWLKEKTENTVRVLSNARCLSEGVDVPALDAVLFLNPRDSQVDVVQSVGRVMRRSPGKQYGYVILPITVPLGKTAEEALEDNNRYKVVWQVLQALRSHDERFNAMVNKIDLTGETDDRFKVIGIGGSGDDSDAGSSSSKPVDTSFTLDFPLEDWKDAILAKIVQKVGQRTYWENWASDVADIAKNHIARISHLVSTSQSKVSEEFSLFLKGLQDNLNPSITEADAIEMLSQHLITKPVFDALFEGYAFTELNPVSLSMQKMVDALDSVSINRDLRSLEDFYESVRMRASGITDGAAKQKIVKELYEKFFRLAFSGTSEKLGIVYTPNEVVDFIIHSVDGILKREFRSGIGHDGVHVLDPFTGTGTFIVRLMQSGLISREQLIKKFNRELHANEIVLLAYYVAAINIEETYHSITGDYSPFQGVVLTDTFQMTEGKDSLDNLGVFPDNNERVKKQNALDIRVVIGNPPYSVGQKSGNDDNKNIKYEDLDNRILNTYAELSGAGNKRNLYDSYIRAYRWASDRIKDKGIVAFVSNGGWLDSKSADGFRKSLVKEFSSIYVFNLRGNANTQGELRRKEGGGVFAEGSRTSVAISVLVKNPDSAEMGKIYYYEVGDGLSASDKLKELAEFAEFASVPLVDIIPNQSADWIKQRSAAYEAFVPLVETDGSVLPAIFTSQATGITTNRDAWLYNFSRLAVVENATTLIRNFNANIETGGPQIFDGKAIKWSRGLKQRFDKSLKIDFEESAVKLVQYRPFQKQWVYNSKTLNDGPSTQGKFFSGDVPNLVLVYGVDGAWISDVPVDLHLNGPGASVLPLYLPDSETTTPTLFDGAGRNYAISSEALDLFSNSLAKAVSEEDLFFYCYGVFSSKQFQHKYGDDLGKVKARVPISKDFEAISQLGRELAKLQIGYETLEPFKFELVSPLGDFRKLRLTRGPDGVAIEADGRTVISGIPEAALDFKVFGRSPIEWIVDRYQVSTDKESGIVNNANDYNEGSKTVLSLIGSVTTFAIEAVEIQKKLGKFEL